MIFCASTRCPLSVILGERAHAECFKLENSRLSRLELDEADDLKTSLWVDLVEPDELERERVQHELGQKSGDTS